MLDMRKRRALARERIEQLEDEARKLGKDPKTYVQQVLGMDSADNVNDIPMPHRQVSPPTGSIH